MLVAGKSWLVSPKDSGLELQVWIHQVKQVLFIYYQVYIQLANYFNYFSSSTHLLNTRRSFKTTVCINSAAL